MGATGRKLQVLFVEDSIYDVELELLALRDGNLIPTHAVVQSESELLAALEPGRFDLVICDYSIPGFGGLQALAIVKRFDPDLPVLLVSGTIGEDAAVAAVRGGAYDYVLKDNLTRLAVAVERALEEAQVRRDKRRQERAQRFLAEAGAALAESLDYQTTLSRVARLAVPELADVCAVELVVEDDRVVVAHAESDGALPIEQQTQRIEVPLEARGRVLGSLAFGKSRPGELYDSVDFEIARELARRAALAVDNAKLYLEAQQAIRTRDEFLSVASHELKTPLTAMQLQLEGLLEIVDRNPLMQGEARLRSRLARTSQSTLRLAALIESLLDVSRIATGRMQLNLERFDLVEAAHSVADRLNEEAQRAGSRLVLAYGAAIAGSWDRLRIEQVLINLLSNAIKYGCAQPIELHLDAGEGRAAIRVVDHGIGVDEADRERIFGRFERAVPVRHYGGMGLGLYIAQQIVSAHGGTIGVTSTPGGGASFAVALPLEPISAVAAAG
jgi:signal transduction histidine kinase